MFLRTLMAMGVLAASTTARAQFDGFENKGLVGVGRLPASLFDKAGDGAADTLGGFSAMAVDAASLVYEGGTIRGTLVGLPDRGFGDGATDYHPRLELFTFSITPYEGAGPVGQDQITFTNTATVLLTYDDEGTPQFFTGFDAGNTNNPVVPQSPANSLGGGRRSIDPEGIVLAPEGGYWVSDEYGPGVFRFDVQARLQETLLPPEALLPKQGSYPGKLNFNGNTAPTSGRRNNRGLEGLSLTPDGKRLVAFLQSPTIQDGGGGNLGRNTRVLQFDVVPNSPTYGQVVAEHIYQLTLNGSAQNNRHTPVSEVLALNASTFLALERDGNGLGTGTNVAPVYKRIVALSTAGATNLAGSAYDLEKGAPGSQLLPASDLGFNPVARKDLVDLLDPVQLGKFGLNAAVEHDTNTLCEKWEALALIPLKDAANPDDYLLLVGNDNDFKAPLTVHNGIAVGTNDVSVDLMILAYRVTLPGVAAPRPANFAPTARWTSPTTGVWAGAAPLPLTVGVYDPDGRVVSVEFFDGDALIGTVRQYPFSLLVPEPTPGLHSVRAVITDNDGATFETAPQPIHVSTENLAPSVTLTSPVDGAAGAAPYHLRFTAEAGDGDGVITNVTYYAGARKLGANPTAPFGFTFSNAPVGVHVLTAVATDNLGLNATSAPVTVTVTRALGDPLQLQILHASDFEAGIAALDDAPRFSSVLAALRADLPEATLTLASGDNYIPGPFFTASADPAAPFGGIKGRADITILNALGIQASCFGNHEFDDNTPLVRSLILADAAAQYSGTAFPYLSANLNFAPDSSLASLVAADGQDVAAVKNKIAKSAVVTVAGQRIGLVGATVPELRTISSPGAVGVSQNLAEDIQAAVDGVVALGCNKVILMTHLQQFSREFELAAQLRDVDVIVAGGSHSVFSKPSDRLRPEDFSASPYPTQFVSASGQPVYVVNTGSNYRYVGRLIASFDGEGVLTGFDSRSGAYATDIQGVLDTGNLPPNPTVLTVVSNLATIVDGKDGNRFGRTAVYLNGLRNSVRTEEANLGSLSADANLFRARQTDPSTVISLKNGGGIRDSIGAISSAGGVVERIPPPANPRVGKQAGEVSQLDIENSLRFNNTLSLVTLTAQQLRDTMEWSVAASGTPGQFPQVSGLLFSFVPTNKPMTYLRNASGVPTAIDFAGERLQNLVVVAADDSQDLVVENGQLVGDPNRTFRIVTLNFMAGGGDSYFPLTLGANRVDLVPAGTTPTFDTDGGEQRALADYLKFIQIYSEADTPAEHDLRIQNLLRRGDVVLAPWVRKIEVPVAGAELTFRTLPGRHYVVESKESIDAPWQPTGLETQGTGTPRTLVDTRPAGPQQYYRVLLSE